MRMNFLKCLAVCSALLMLTACGGGSGGGGDSSSSGGSGRSGAIAYALTMNPEEILYLNGHSTWANIDLYVEEGREIPAAIFTVINADGSTRLATMADLYFFEDSSATKTATGFTVKGAYENIVPAANARDSILGGTINVRTYNAQNFDANNRPAEYQFLHAFNGFQKDENDSSLFQLKSVRLQRPDLGEVEGSGLSRIGGIAMPQGATFVLSGDGGQQLAPMAMQCDELGINWTVGQAAPVLSQEGECVLTITPALAEPVSFKLTVYGELESIRLDAGLDVDGEKPVLIPETLMPYQVTGVSKSGKELDLSSLYKSVDNHNFNLTVMGVKTLAGAGSTFEVIFDETHGQPANAPQLLGLPTSKLSLPVDVRKADRIEVKQKRYFAEVGDKIPRVKIDAILDGKRFAINTFTSFYFKLDHSSAENLIDYQKGIAIAPGISTAGFYTGSISAETPAKSYDGITLEVGDKVSNNAIKGVWKYVDDGSDRHLGDYISESYTEVNSDLLKLASGRYIARAGISDVTVTAQAKTLAGDNISGNLVSGKSVSNIATRAGGIGGGNVIFHNVDTGESVEVSPVDGAINTELPTGEYQVSSQVQVDNGDGTVGYAVFSAPAIVDGAAIDLGTFTAADAGLYNFKVSLVSKEFVYFPNITYGAVNSNSEIRLVIQNISSHDVSGLHVQITADDSNNLFTALSTQTFSGGLTAGDSEELGVAFRMNQPTSGDEIATINVKITDIDGRVWNDKVSFTVSSVGLINLRLSARRGDLGGYANGYIVAPGNKLIKLSLENDTGAGAQYWLPNANASGEYKLILANTSASSESAYGIGVNVAPIIANLTGYPHSDKQKGEPANNDISGAVDLNVGERYENYLLSNDIDYYRILVPTNN